MAAPFVGQPVKIRGLSVDGAGGNGNRLELTPVLCFRRQRPSSRCTPARS